MTTTIMPGPYARRPEMRALTGLRAVAALAVVFHHTRLPESAPQALDKIAEWGRMGVPVFFMLSGVVLAYNYGDLNFKQGRRTIRFFLARIARVMPLYWAVIAYCAGFYFIVGLDQYQWPLVQNILAIQTWSGDLKVAQGYYNAPGWSIGVELFFYLLFPFLIPQVARLAKRWGNRGLIALIGAMTLVLLALWAYFMISGRAHLPAADPGSAHRWLYRSPLCYLPLFVIGMAVAFLIPSVRTWSIRTHHLTQGALFVLIGGIAVFRPIGTGWSTASFALMLAVPFAILLLTLATDRGWMARFLATGPMVRLGVASYALYITHRWLMERLAGFTQIEKGTLWTPYVGLLMVVVLLLLIAEGAHQYIEEPCRRLIVKWTNRLIPAKKHQPEPTPPRIPEQATVEMPPIRDRIGAGESQR